MTHLRPSFFGPGAFAAMNVRGKTWSATRFKASSVWIENRRVSMASTRNVAQRSCRARQNGLIDSCGNFCLSTSV